MKLKSWRVVPIIALVLGGLALIPSSAAAGNPVPTGTLVVPAVNASWSPGQTITLTTTAQDNNVTPGYPQGVTDVEWWLYSDTTLGDSANWSSQYPGNTENKIFLGDSSVPSSGTTVNGTWTVQFTVPTNGTMTVTRDGEDPGGLPAPRIYQVPTGTYSVQSYIQNAWWLANEGVETGKTAMTTITLNAGAGTITPTPTPTPTPTTTPGNLVTNPSAESGSTCYQQTGYGTNTAVFSTTTTAHTGSGALSLAMNAYTNGDRKWLTTMSNACAPVVTTGHTYTASVWINSTSADNNLTVFAQTTAGWVYWTDLARSQVTTGWQQMSAVTPPIPTGTTRLSFGVSTDAVGTLLTDDYSLVDTAGGSTPTPTPTITPTPTLTPTPTPTVTPTPTGTNLVQNPSLDQTVATPPTCFEQDGWGDGTVTGAYVPGHTGQGWAVTVAGKTTGDTKLLQAGTAACAPTVVTGHTYTMSVWYEGAPAGLTIFSHTASGWGYWTDVAVPPASTTWADAVAVTPPIPSGVNQISFGLSQAANGTLATDDYSLTDTAGGTPTPTPSPTSTPSTGPWTGNALNGTWQTLSYLIPNREVHSTVLDNGKVLLMAGSGNDPNLFAAGTFTTDVWDPNTGVFTTIKTPQDMFCAGHITLANGEVLIMGGTKAYPAADGSTYFEGLNTSYIFNPANNTFTKLSSLTQTGHWYPGMTELGNGNIFATGGLNEVGVGTVATEMFNYPTLAWLNANAVAQTYSYWGTYPHMWLLADGRLFYDGAHVFGNGLPGTGASLYNINTATIEDVPGLRDKDLRDQAGSALLPPAQMQKVAIFGGGNTDTNNAGISLTDEIDLTQPNPTYVPEQDMPGPGKLYVNTVVLPDRTVLTTGGAVYNRADSVHTSAIFYPATGTWLSIPSEQWDRGYHTSAFLLPDGRVVVLGGNPLDNSFQMEISIYSPGYLYRTARPTINSVSATTWKAGSTQSITVSTAAGVTPKFVNLLAPMSVTHQTDNQMRLVDVPFTMSGNTLTLSVPSNDNIIPPGPYMLELQDSNDVPSVATWIMVTN